MCTLVNDLGGNASGVTISYNFTTTIPVTEEILGHRVYYSLTGAAGTWTQVNTGVPAGFVEYQATAPATNNIVTVLVEHTLNQAVTVNHA